MPEKTRLDIDLVLPPVPDARDACIQRLTDLLTAKEGIEAAHLADRKDAGPGQICIHYSPDRLSIGEVRALAERAGAELDQRYGHLLVHAQAMHARQTRSIEQRVRQIDGVLESAASPAGMLRIEFDRQAVDEGSLRTDLQTIGVGESGEKQKVAPPTEVETEGAAKEHEHEHGGLFGEKTELGFSLVCGGLLLTGWLLSTFFAELVAWWAPLAIYIGAYFFGGFFTLREAIENIRAGRFEIDCLMLVAAIGAATLGEWAEGALLLFLFSLGHSLENYATARSTRAARWKFRSRSSRPRARWPAS